MSSRGRYSGWGKVAGAVTGGASLRGLTLIEILVVISIVSILTAGLVSGIHSMTGGEELSKSIDSVVRMVSLARNRAITDNAVFHVRVENRNFNDQKISVHRFPTLSDALKATDEEWVYANKKGWHDTDKVARASYVIAIEKLGAKTVFETSYDPAVLIYKNRRKTVPVDPIHQLKVDNPKKPPKWIISYPTLFYSGKWLFTDKDNPYPAYKPIPSIPSGPEERPNLLPKFTPDYSSLDVTNPKNMDAPARPQLLYFNPDGTTTGNFLFILRVEDNLGYVQVWPSGMIATGLLNEAQDFKNLNKLK